MRDVGGGGRQSRSLCRCERISALIRVIRALAEKENCRKGENGGA